MSQINKMIGAWQPNNKKKNFYSSLKKNVFKKKHLIFYCLKYRKF